MNCMDCGKEVSRNHYRCRSCARKGERNPNYGKHHSEQVKSKIRMARTTHGGTGTRLYNIWQGMLRRCFDKNNKDYPRYGDRDIYVIPEWFDFAVFRDWSLANGFKEGLVIHRKDNDDYYCPENCEWISFGEHSSIHNRTRRL